MKLRHFGLVATVGLAALAFGGTGRASGAGTVDCFSATVAAAADGVRVIEHGENVLPLINEADAEGPSATALVGRGVSSAAAGSPYSTTALSLPGLAGVDPSTYPLAVQSQYPSKTHAAASYTGLSLTADSTDTTSKASVAGGGANPAGSDASGGATTETAGAQCSSEKGLVADADTDSEVLSFAAGALRIGRIHSEAHASVDLDGKPHVRAALQLGEVTVAGQSVGLGDQGISSPGGAVPIPNPLADVLGDQGITVTYVAATTDPDGKGVTAPGLMVAVSAPLNTLPVEPIGSGPTTVVYTFGRATARADGPGAVAAAGPGTSPSAPAAVQGPPGGESGPALAPPEATAGDPVQQPVVPRPGPATVTEPSAAASALALGVPDLDWELVYLAVVVGAGAVIGGNLLLRYLGERWGWT